MADSNSGRLIVFEGGDGIGKSHLAKELSSFLHSSGIPVTQLSFPGRREGSLGNLVYSVHHRPAEFGIQTMTTLGLQALHIAAHLDEIASIILPALNSGTWVVLDRFWWSTWVYGVHGGADRSCLELLIEAEKQAWGGVRPATPQTFWAIGKYGQKIIMRLYCQPSLNGSVSTWPIGLPP